jgi:hypothetical protein
MNMFVLAEIGGALCAVAASTARLVPMLELQRDKAAEAAVLGGNALQADSQASDSSRVSGRHAMVELSTTGATESSSGTST